MGLCAKSNLAKEIGDFLHIFRVENFTGPFCPSLPEMVKKGQFYSLSHGMHIATFW